FHGESLEEFIKDFVAEFKSGLFDDLIIYKKRLSKPLDEYTKSNPPHVKAAKLLREKNPDMFIKDVEYVMTRFGPIPASFEIKDVDYSHYIDKQLAPIGNDVLKFLEKDFDDIVSGSQMTLF
ncbi:MAG: DNA polymerase II, partial [Bdellovibrionota bacterium]|nr:DNA polymerase II [Bdellovibrionota bacterium]